MHKVAILSDGERAELFTETARQRGLAPAIIEKDFWVCWILGHIFDTEQIRDAVLFKGGTALAKAFRLIERFSEDIDLAVDYAPLGFIGQRDPASEMSRSRRERLLDEMMAACHAYISGEFTAALRHRIENSLGDRSRWALAVDAKDPNAVRFRYPSAGVGALAYVRPEILLELGTHAELIPSGRYTVTPFAAEQFPQVFDQATCSVRAIVAERTFWEKATILHVEHHRPADKPLPSRHARHYYDMAMLVRSPICETAVNDIELLERVVAHKTKFYNSAWARYDLATPATLSLVPTPERIAELRRDYVAMSPMLFGEPPRLDDLLGDLTRLQVRINRQP